MSNSGYMSARDLDQHSLQPGACSLCAAASKVIANFGEIFSIYYLFPQGLHQSFAGQVCWCACSSAATTWSPPTCATLHPSHSTLTSMRKENVPNLANFLIRGSVYESHLNVHKYYLFCITDNAAVIHIISLI